MSWDDLTTTLSLKKHFRNAIINFKQNSVNPTVALFDMVPVKGPFKTLSLTVTVKPKSETNQYKQTPLDMQERLFKLEKEKSY